MFSTWPHVSLSPKGHAMCYLNNPVLWSIDRRGRRMVSMGISWGSCTPPGILALPGLGKFAYSFWQKVRHVLCQVAADISVEHPSRARVLNSGTSSSRHVHKAFLESNPFISLKCCFEFRVAKWQSSDSDGKIPEEFCRTTTSPSTIVQRSPARRCVRCTTLLSVCGLPSAVQANYISFTEEHSFQHLIMAGMAVLRRKLLLLALYGCIGAIATQLLQQHTSSRLQVGCCPLLPHSWHSACLGLFSPPDIGSIAMENRKSSTCRSVYSCHDRIWDFPFEPEKQTLNRIY